MLTDDQETVVRSFWASTCTMIVVGPPGCGKTLMMHHIANAASKSGPTEALAWCAPTGVARKHLPNCRIPCTKSEWPPMTLAYLLKSKFLERLQWMICQRKITFVHVVLDEFPMVDGQQFNELLKQLRSLTCRNRIVCIGDPSQLPAVGISVFSSLYFQRLLKDEHVVKRLTTQVRFKRCPTNDMAIFCRALQLRHVNLACLMIMDRFVKGPRPPPGGSNVLYLAATNEARQLYNDEALSFRHAINRSIIYTAVNKAGAVVRFASDGQVMVTKNSKSNRDLVNGAMFTLRAVTGTPIVFNDEEYADARVLRLDKHLELTIVDETLPVSQQVEHILGTVCVQGVYEIHATPADCITYHKSQGMTWPGMLVLDLARCSFEHLYVGFTRATTFGNLHVLPCDLGTVEKAMQEPVHASTLDFMKHVQATVSN